MSQESPLFAKFFDLMVYLFQVTEKFPRSQRVVLGRRVQEICLAILDRLLRARKCPPDERGELLQQADLDLDRLRYTVRLCQALGLLSQKQYVHAAGLLAETGKLLGTWVKRYNQT